MLAIKNLFNADTSNIYTMPPGVPFLEHLAKGLTAALGADLHTALILLPTRRAVRELSAAFLKEAVTDAVLLPRMSPLADMGGEEWQADTSFVGGDIELGIASAIDPVRHKFELAQLVVQKMKADGSAPDTISGAVNALAMSEPLANLLSDLAVEELGADALRALDEQLATLPVHFQNAAEFANIIARHWPQHLAELGLSEPSAHLVAMINACAQQWVTAPPQHPIIIAGSTGTWRATANLIKTVSKLPKGLVVLPGLDTHIDEVVWDSINAEDGDQHPQRSLKTLIQILGVERKDVPVWPGAALSPKAKMRNRILAESLVPADATSDWPARIARVHMSDSTGNALQDGLAGLSLIEAKTQEEEASIIALILRETLENPNQTAALVTPDPSLARRVKAKLSRYGIEADSSQGEPLEETLHGAFAALCVQAAVDVFDPVALSALVKHTLFGMSKTGVASWSRFEKRVLRGPRASSLDVMTMRAGDNCADGLALYKNICAALLPLSEQLQGEHNASELAKAHTQVLETLGGGAANIWRGTAGEQMASLLEDLIAYGALLPPVDGQGYMRLLSQMMRGRVVRPRYGMHERLQILGPLEARMIAADKIVLGGLNEGVWPAPPAVHPVLSRGMRMAIGMNAPERRFGLAAHDFAQLAAKPNVVLTRAARTTDGPAVQSRWLWRLTTLVKGAQSKTGVNIRIDNGAKYVHWARTLDAPPQHLNPAARPEPCPPLSARWPKGRGLSVTQIQTWIRDPYAVYAKTVLGLYPLDPLDQSLGGREYGKAVHKALEVLDGKTTDQMYEILRAELRVAGYLEHSFSRHDVRLKRMANWCVEWARARRAQGWAVRGIEKKGRFEMPTPHGPFTLTGIADRIETKGNGAAMIDYKTGKVSTQKEIRCGFDPQLPLLTILLAQGCLGAPINTSEMRYIKPNASKEKDKDINVQAKEYSVQDYADEARQSLEKLIAYFDREDSVYASQPRAKYVNPYGDYDQLARRAEWATLEGEDGDNT